jgi:prepilin-type N-terminal cleavage/methylation domain-containing protein
MGKKGYTLIEILLVLAIVGILLSITMVSLSTVQQNTYQNSSLDILLSDIKLQQLKSMSGNLETAGTAPFGVHFETNSYTIFQGNSYVNGTSGNFTVPLNPNVEFNNILFPQSRILFNRGSGEITGFTTGNDSVTMVNTTTGDQIVIRFNRYGVVTQAN